MHHDYHCRVNFPRDYHIGTRWVHPNYGYVPIGYCQLWHCDASEWRGVKHRRYPERHNDASRCDVQFALQWDRRHRVHLPEVIAVHLESQEAKLGANWKGRTTVKFGPGEAHRLPHHHHKHHHPHPHS
jgi:hypothetical protein